MADTNRKIIDRNGNYEIFYANDDMDFGPDNINLSQSSDVLSKRRSESAIPIAHNE